MTHRAPQWQHRTLRAVLAILEAIDNPDHSPEIAALNEWLARTPSDPPELAASKRIVKNRSHGLCEANTHACTGDAAHVHHKAGRGWDGCHHPDMLIDVCRACHDHIHANPTISYEVGWMTRRNGARQ